MARLKFLLDAERCIECNACVTACKNENEVPWGINRRRVVTINDGTPGERSVSVACMHCSDAPCMAVCPVDCFYQTKDGVVLHSKDLCHGCRSCPPADTAARRTGRHRSSSHNRCTGPWSAAPHRRWSGRSNPPGRQPCRVHPNNACKRPRSTSHPGCHHGWSPPGGG